MNKPNFLFLMTDHQREDTLGMVQCGREVTPNLNRLAKESRVFKRAYDTCPLCVPARTALATGVYPTQNHVVYNDWNGTTAGAFEPIHVTLKKAGYQVGHAGVDHIRIRPLLREQNLDFFVNQEDYVKFAQEKNVQTQRNPEELVTVKEEIQDEYVEKKYSGYLDTVWPNPIETFKDMFFKERSLEFLNKIDPEKPFALFTYLWAPHPPLKVPEPYASMYDPEKLVLPENVGIASEGEPELRRKGVPAQLAEGVNIAQWRKTWAAYLGLTTMADDIFGCLMEELKKKGVYENTCIIFTADHGDHLGQHSMYQKMEMYEEAVKVPLLIRMPGMKPGVCEELVSHLDINPTMREMIGVSHDELEGVSLIPALEGKKLDENRTVFSQYSGNPDYGTIRRAAITKRYKYVFDGAYEHELYDLEKDPHEMKNVALEQEYKPITERLHRECEEYHKNHEDYFKWEKSEKR